METYKTQKPIALQLEISKTIFLKIFPEKYSFSEKTLIVPKKEPYARLAKRFFHAETTHETQQKTFENVEGVPSGQMKVLIVKKSHSGEKR